MKKKLTVILSVLLVLTLLISSLALAVSAASVTLSYTFTGANSADAGFAQGTIKLTVGSGKGGDYELFWADDNEALSGFDAICTLNVSSGSSVSYDMPQYTAIPAQATSVIAVGAAEANENISVASAEAAYKLPKDKLLLKSKDDMLYSFASLSDIHTCSNESGSNTGYPYDEEHIADAFRTAAERDVDFIITTGDNVNNQRNDSKGGANPFYPEEWKTYLKILAESDYVNPVYEAIGNHELWCYDTESNYKNMDWKTGSDYFRAMTGLDSNADTLESGKAYYEIIEPVTGDHFLFMALEGGFYTDRVEEFSDEQLSWLEEKLSAYENDGKNTFILEHANFYKWGAGDQIDKPIYNIPLKDTNTQTAKLKAILQRYKNAVLICGHTHFKFDLQLNYSTNEATSATIIHNSSVGGVRNILDRTTRVNDKSRELTEGYIVEVYDNATVFYGTNLYYNKINPSTSYIVPQTTSAIAEPTEPPTQAPTEAPTQAPTEPLYVLYGDADEDGEVSVLDVTFIQRVQAGIDIGVALNKLNGDVDGDGDLTVLDATYIQRKLAGYIKHFPVETVTENSKDLASTSLTPPIVPADYQTLRAQSEYELGKYWLISSYDQYQALKKAYKEDYAYDELASAYADFYEAVQRYYSGDTVCIYFTNNLNWSNVYAYCSEGSGKEKNASWPGQKMTYVSTNSYGQKVYELAVPKGKYNIVIFSNGSRSQTVDLPLGVLDGQGFYYDHNLGKDSSGHYRCSGYTYR